MKEIAIRNYRRNSRFEWGFVSPHNAEIITYAGSLAKIAKARSRDSQWNDLANRGGTFDVMMSYDGDRVLQSWAWTPDGWAWVDGFAPDEDEGGYIFLRTDAKAEPIKWETGEQGNAAPTEPLEMTVDELNEAFPEWRKHLR